LQIAALTKPNSGFTPVFLGVAHVEEQHGAMKKFSFPTRRVEWLARLLVPPLVAGLALAGIQLAAVFDEPPQFSWVSTMVLVALVYVMAEGIRWISRWLDHYLPWRNGGSLRGFTQFFAGLIFSCGFLLSVYIPVKLHEISQGSNDELAWPHIVFTLLVALVFGTALAALQLLFDFFEQWRQAEVAAEQQRQAVLRAELDALKAHINPHFLFNSFNTVYGLIGDDPARARAVLLELSDVFRYVLQHGAHDLVTLAVELDFLQAYLRVLRARHGEALRVSIDDCGNTRTRSLPPMTLQLLVENAVRHNELESEGGLTVHIYREGESLTVSNPIRPRRGDTRGTGSGLHQIVARYCLLSTTPVRIEHDALEFRVRIPLLPCAS
jgi:hypothetical protein